MQFGILGPLEVVGDDGAAIAIRGARERTVLVYLLLEAGRAVPADRLIDQLWGEEAPDSARKSLQVRVAGLRRALGDGRIETRASGYAVRVTRRELDLHRFEDLLSEATDADPAGAARLLHDALELWRGPALADARDRPWADAAAARLDELRLLAVERRIDADLALGRHREAAAEIEGIVREHPLRERLRAQQMLALYRCGRQADALAAFRDARSALVDGLGIEPGQPLRDLEQSILRQERTLELATVAPPRRSIVAAAVRGVAPERVVRIAALLAADGNREVIVLRPDASRDALAAATAELSGVREGLLAGGIAARVSAFASPDPGADLVRSSRSPEVELLLVTSSGTPLADEHVAHVLVAAPCDVAVLTGGEIGSGPVLVPFTGADHDWSAVQLGAWIALASKVRLRLVAPGDGTGRTSRLLGDASLAVQLALGVVAEPHLIEATPDALVRAAADAGVSVAGLSDRWRADGLGEARARLAAEADTAVLLVRRGLRPGGVAPPESYTRFTWTLRP
jgi:DNA-binding SARP family transcriptional activator